MKKITYTSIVRFLRTINNFLKPNKLLIIRLDAIGDYVLFRNFLQILKESTKYKKYSFTLLGNEVWKNLAEFYDSEYIDDFIWINRNKISEENGAYYFASILDKLKKQNFRIVIYPTYSREFYLGDFIVNQLDAKKIGFDGDNSNISKEAKERGDKYYDLLISSDKKIKFEFCRNKEFFSKFLRKNLTIARPKLEYKKNILKDSDYIVLFPGAAVDYRRWSVNKFADLCKLIIQRFSVAIIIAGDSKEIQLGSEIKYLSNSNKVINNVGLTTLCDLVNTIGNAQLLISNETSAVHIAAATDTPAICISNGNHFGRFNPYPKEIAKYIQTIYPPIISNEITFPEQLVEKYGFGSNIDINLIEIEEVYKAVEIALVTFK